jgi:hypothetical protein
VEQFKSRSILGVVESMEKTTRRRRIEHWEMG